MALQDISKVKINGFDPNAANTLGFGGKRNVLHNELAPGVTQFFHSPRFHQCLPLTHRASFMDIRITLFFKTAMQDKTH